MRLATLLTVATAIAACLIGAHCAPDLIRAQGEPPHITHVDGDTIEILADLTDPAKLDKLTGKRAATPRLRKTCYWLSKTRDPSQALARAQVRNGTHGTLRAQETTLARIPPELI